MAQISLKKLIARQEVSPVIQGLINTLNTPTGIQDVSGKLLIGEVRSSRSGKHPVELKGEVIGWVLGGKKGAAIAALLSCLANNELEKKTLALETLDKYKELNLLYNIADKIGPCLDTKEIAKIILSEARKLIQASAVSIMFLNEALGRLEILTPLGKEYEPKTTFKLGGGNTSGHQWARSPGNY